jgi:salicylate hydroxylase
MGQGDCWALFRSLQQTYKRHNNSAIHPNSSQGNYNLKRALRLYNETRRHFLGRVELQMDLDGTDARYLAEAGSDEDEWIRRFQERNKNQLWLTEHDVEAEFVKTFAAESLWSRE